MALKHEAIVEAALLLVGAVGLEGLSMRKLARALGVQAPALYWHFADKQALLDSMADVLLQGVAERLDMTGAGKLVLKLCMVELRERLLLQRDGAKILAGTFVSRPATLRLADILIGAMMRDGYTADAALSRIFPLFHYVLGFVIEEQAFAQQLSSEARQSLWAAKRREMIELGHSPIEFHLNQWLTTDPDARFAVGAELLLHGL